ncbi:MAG: glycosyl hydrolase, partial [Candidatus Acidiferrales bacterium]
MIIAAIAILGIPSGIMASSTGEIDSPSGVIPPSLFDLNILFHPSTKVPWPAVPFYGWRLSHADWSTLEPAKDQYDFDLVDKYVAWGQQHNTEILMTLTYTPQWASSTPNVRTAPGLGVSGPPNDMGEWKKYVRTVAERYNGKIHIYEIWNEPDKTESWTGSVDTMVSMVREASRILKEVDPSITIVSPPPTGPKGVNFLQQFLAHGGGQFVDVIGYHFYVAENPPEAMVPLIRQVKSIMNQNGIGNKPLWNTEAGWYAPKPFPSQELAAGYVARSYVLNWLAGVSRFYWYCWDNHNWTTLELTMPDNT